MDKGRRANMRKQGELEKRAGKTEEKIQKGINKGN